MYECDFTSKTPTINTLKCGMWYNKHSFKHIAELVREKWNSPPANFKAGLETRAVSSCVDDAATLGDGAHLRNKRLGF